MCNTLPPPHLPKSGQTQTFEVMLLTHVAFNNFVQERALDFPPISQQALEQMAGSEQKGSVSQWLFFHILLVVASVQFIAQ